MRNTVAWASLAAALAACGGGGSNPLGNPPTVQNPPGETGQKLSFVYFQKCVNPVFLARLTINQKGVLSTNTCAAGGCHDDATGTGGALRLNATAATIDLADPANTPEVVRLSQMYRNFYSAQGSTLLGSPEASLLVLKPLVEGLHGGGVIFEGPDDPNAKLIRYWISRPVPEGQDEFSASAASMFTPADPLTGACNSE